MNYTLDEIRKHKNKLYDLSNKLINTFDINQEIMISNEIKYEAECLLSLLNIKKSELNQQNYINNNLNVQMFNPSNYNANNFNDNNLINNNFNNNIHQLDQQMVQQQMLFQQQIKNFNPLKSFENNEPVINVKFIQRHKNNLVLIHCNPNEKISDVIEKYREKSGDYNENDFIFNSEKMNNLTCTLSQCKIMDQSWIDVIRKATLK